MKSPKLIRMTTIPMSLRILLTDQLAFMSRQGFEVVAVSSSGSFLDEVAEIVGQVRIDAVQEALVGEVAVLADGDLAEEEIAEKDVAAYFAQRDRTAAELTPLDIDMLGYVRNWPKDFFGDEMGDIAAHAQAALKKRRERGGTGVETPE